MSKQVASITTPAQSQADEQDLMLAQEAVDWSAADAAFEERINFEGSNYGYC